MPRLAYSLTCFHAFHHQHVCRPWLKFRVVDAHAWLSRMLDSGVYCCLRFSGYRLTPFRRHMHLQYDAPVSRTSRSQRASASVGLKPPIGKSYSLLATPCSRSQSISVVLLPATHDLSRRVRRESLSLLSCLTSVMVRVLAFASPSCL